MINDPIGYAKQIQIHQKLQALESFIQQWDADKVAALAKQRIEELQAMERNYRVLIEKQKEMTAQQQKNIDEQKNVRDILLDDTVNFFIESRKVLNVLRWYCIGSGVIQIICFIHWLVT